MQDDEVTVVNVHDAKTHLSKLLARVEAGEQIVIARAGKPVAQLGPVSPLPRADYHFLDIELPADFFEPLTEEELAEWE